jgi:hypothetical protein
MSLLAQTIAEVRIVASLLPFWTFLRWSRGLLLAAPDMIRQHSLGPVDQMFGESFDFYWKGRAIHIDKSDMGIVREIFGHRCYVSRSNFTPVRNVLDLGCNTGLFTIFAILEAPGCRIRAVDVQWDLVEGARHNLAQFGNDRVTLECAIVGDMETDWIRVLRRQNPTLAKFNLHEYLVSVGRCDFLKCDVEGAEFSLFSGNLSWTRAVGAMAIEVHPEHGDPRVLEASLRCEGFRVETEPHGSLEYMFCERH